MHLEHGQNTVQFVNLLNMHKGQKPRVHDSRRNLSGSSKAMEPDVGAELAATCENQAWCSSGNPGWR